MVQAALENFGSLDVLVLNAGLTSPGMIDALPLESFDHVLNVNLRGSVLGLRAALPALSESGEASVVMTASVSGLGGDPGMWAYNVAKGGVVNYTRTLAIDHAREGIRVNAICPGPIETALTDALRRSDEFMAAYARTIPMGRMGTPEEISGVAAFLGTRSGRRDSRGPGRNCTGRLRTTGRMCF